MRIAFVGAGEITVRTAELLIERGHEVIIIENNPEKIEELSDILDCSFLNGDGSKPAILREVGPDQTDVLFCLSDSDQANLISSLVGRSLGFKRVIPSLQDPEFEGICRELDLKDAIVPSRTISRYLADMVEGVDILELSTVIKGEARFFTFTVDKEKGKRIAELDLPGNARVVCYYREGRFSLADEETSLRKGDEMVILTHSESIPDLTERWRLKEGNNEES
ncbi:MAG: TrkA family potassium uptake protein [Deltaproteobacteria bacterium]|nr:TrkA family potassium uptake protein [Deltaproteobacteria bacterium]